jgi:hypothetical protein
MKEVNNVMRIEVERQLTKRKQNVSSFENSKRFFGKTSLKEG